MKMMTLPGNKKPKKKQKEKKTGKTLLTQVMFYGEQILRPTQTVTPVGSYALQCPCQFPM